jgi:15-cis-phytoene synthase
LQAPLLGIYALMAELQALRDPATERSVAALKLAWWVEEMQRLRTGAGAHPISRYLRALDRGQHVDFTPLAAAATAAAFDAAGAPLERATELVPHADALWGGPLRIATLLGGEAEDADLCVCTQQLAAGDYLIQALQQYPALARQGRIPFAVDALLGAGIENQDLVAAAPSAPLEAYLQSVRGEAARHCAAATAALPRSRRRALRHLLVLAALGERAVSRPRATRWQHLTNVFLAWRVARRA